MQAHLTNKVCLVTFLPPENNLHLFFQADLPAMHEPHSWIVPILHVRATDTT